MKKVGLLLLLIGLGILIYFGGNIKPDYDKINKAIDDHREDLNTALEIINKEIKRFPKDEPLRTYRVSLLYMHGFYTRGLFEEALKIVNQDLIEFPENLGLRSYKLQLLINTCKFAEAQNEIKYLYSRTKEDFFLLLNCAMQDNKNKKIQCYQDLYTEFKRKGKVSIEVCICAYVIDADDLKQMKEQCLQTQDEQGAAFFREMFEHINKDEWLSGPNCR